MRENVAHNAKSGIDKLFETLRKEDIQKAIVIENNRILTYGYERPSIAGKVH